MTTTLPKKIINSFVFAFIFFFLASIPPRFLFQFANPFEDDNIVKPVDEMFLGNGLVNKVYAGFHGDMFCAEENDDPIVAIDIDEEISGCNIYPIAYAHNDFGCGDKDPSTINAQAATFAAYEDCFTWAEELFYGDQISVTPLDWEYFDSAEEYFDKSYYDCSDTSNPPPDCAEGYTDLSYFYADEGKATFHTSASPNENDGQLNTLGGQYLCFYTEPCNLINESGVTYWMLELTNECPVPDAGEDQTVAEGATVNLSGTHGDPDVPCQSPTYLWEQIDSTGYNVSLSGAATASPNFTAPDISEDSVTLTFRLTADDDQCTGTDEVDVIITQSSETEPYCGDGIVQTGEACDDGNSIDGDGCSSECEIEVTIDELPETSSVSQNHLHKYNLFIRVLLGFCLVITGWFIRRSLGNKKYLKLPIKIK